MSALASLSTAKTNSPEQLRERLAPYAVGPIVRCVALLLGTFLFGVHAMSQTPQNTANPSTADEYNALKSLYAAQADAADAQARLLASQKALAAAQAGPDPVAAQLAAATQAANVAAQNKALADSQAGIVKDNFTVPDSGFTGTITAGDKAGNVEAQLLSADAVNIAAERIAGRLTPPGNIVLFGLGDLPDFQALVAFKAQYSSVNALLDDVSKKVSDEQAKAAFLIGPRTEMVTPSVVGAAFDAANKLLGYFRTDYSIQGVTVAADDSLLTAALAGKLRARGFTVTLPAMYNAPALAGNSAILQNLNMLAMKRVLVQQSADAAEKQVDDLTKAATAATDAAKKAVLTAEGVALKTAADQAKVALSLYDGLISKLTTPDDKAKVPLTAIIQQEAIHTALQGAQLMTVKVASTGGTYYTRKNLWSFFGGMPFFVMGGVVVHYTVFDGSTGAVVSAGTEPVDGGFHRVGTLPAKFGAGQK